MLLGKSEYFRKEKVWIIHIISQEWLQRTLLMHVQNFEHFLKKIQQQNYRKGQNGTWTVFISWNSSTLWINGKMKQIKGRMYFTVVTR